MTAYKCKNHLCRKKAPPGQSYCCRTCAPYADPKLFDYSNARTENKTLKNPERPTSIYTREDWLAGGR